MLGWNQLPVSLLYHDTLFHCETTCLVAFQPRPAATSTFSNGITTWHNTMAISPTSPMQQAPAANTKTGQLSSISSNEEDEEPLPEGWKQYHTPDGTAYYYNEKTRDSSWKRPAAPKLQVCFSESKCVPD